MRWAIRTIIRWKRLENSMSIFTIQGKKDSILPCRYMKNPDVTISDGGRLMVVTHASEISVALSELMNLKKSNNVKTLRTSSLTFA